jgi:hypothetical protein
VSRSPQNESGEIALVAADERGWSEVVQAKEREMAPDDDVPGGSSLDTPIDWDSFPELVRATRLGRNIDAYLTDIGVDPSLITSDSVGSV